MIKTERNFKMKTSKISAVILALLMCCSAASCSKSDTTDNKSKADASSASQQLEYDIEGSERLFDSLKEKYADNYKLACKYNGDEYIFSLSSGRAYFAVGKNGERNILLYTADKKTYTIMESAKMYAVSEKDFYIRDSDPIFGATDKFVSAEKNDKSGTIEEHYTLDKEIAGGEGEMVYSFDSKTGELKSYTYTIGEKSATYQVTELTEAEESLFEIPDLSGYKQQSN